jgi:hypothetical protein
VDKYQTVRFDTNAYRVCQGSPGQVHFWIGQVGPLRRLPQLAAAGDLRRAARAGETATRIAARSAAVHPCAPTSVGASGGACARSDRGDAARWHWLRRPDPAPRRPPRVIIGRGELR